MMSMFGPGLIAADDLRHLESAATGDIEAIRWTCARFRLPVFALAFRETKQLEAARSCVQPVLTSLCQRLIDGQVRPADWTRVLMNEVEAWCAAYKPFHLDTADDAEDRASFAFSAVPRIARRRALSAQLCQFELPELLTLIMRLVEDAPLADIASLVLDDQSQLADRLAVAHAQLLQHVSDSEQAATID